MLLVLVLVTSIASLLRFLILESVTLSDEYVTTHNFTYFITISSSSITFCRCQNLQGGP